MAGQSSTPLVLGGLVILALGAGLGWLAAGRCCPMGTVADAPGGSGAAAAASSDAASVLARIDPRRSQVFYPFMNISGPSDEAVTASRELVYYLDTGDRAALEALLETYRKLEEVENFGGEYPTLRWFCEYELAGDQERVTMLENDEGRRFVELFGADDWQPLRRYLTAKYGDARVERGELLYYDEIVRFNSPYRDRWEGSDRVLELLDLEPGMRVVDLGAGAGFYSFRLSEAVGPQGTVYAVEMNPMHLEYLRFVVASEGIQGLEVVTTDGSFPALEPESVDRVYLCATYQTIYLSIREDERDAWMAGVLRALKPGGLFVVSENEPVLEPGVVPFGGISIARPLVEAQLAAYGFEFVDAEAVVPQRYTLRMRKPR